MNRVRLIILAIASFFSTFLISLFTPGYFSNRVVAGLLCGALSLNSPMCGVALEETGDRAIAALSPKPETIQSSGFSMADSPQFQMQLPALGNENSDSKNSLSALNLVINSNGQSNINNGTVSPTSTNQLNQLLCSRPSWSPSLVTFKNNGSTPIDIIWVDFSCKEIKYRTLKSGETYSGQTYTGHVWRVRESLTNKELRTVSLSQMAENFNIGTPAQPPLNPTPKNQLITFELSSAKQVAPGKFQLEMTSTKGEEYKFISTIVKNGTQVYQDSVELVVSGQGNPQITPFKTTFNPGATRIVTRVGNELLTVTSNGKVADLSYQSPSGTVTHLKQITLEPQASNAAYPTGTNSAVSSSDSSKLCKFFGDACNLVSSISNGSILGDYLLPAVKREFPELANEERWRDIDIAVRSLALAPAMSITISTVFPALSKALTVANFTCWFLIKGGMPPIPILKTWGEQAGLGKQILPMIYRFSSSYAKGTQLEAMIDKGLADIRKALGIDICGKPVSASYDATLSNSDINYQQSADLVVKFDNPKNNTWRIEVTGSAMRGIWPARYNVPTAMMSKGSVTFKIKNSGFQWGDRQCNSSLNSFIGVAILSTTGEQLFYKQFQPVNFRGSLPAGAVSPCSATVSL
jgi:hypothetical protein